MNKGKLDQFNETNFSPNVIFHMAPENIVGIPKARTYYGTFLTGFSNIKFEIKEIFGQGNKLTKHWCSAESIQATFLEYPQPANQ